MDIQLAKGVQDVPPEEKILKNEVVNTLSKVFELYGFSPLETPVIERWENLAAKFTAGEASDALKETFKLTDQGKRKLALRFDLTVPLSRYVAMNPNMKLPLKRYEVGRVYRDGPIKLGRYREFWQMDIDTIGTKSMLADAEIVAMASKCFEELGLKIGIKVNNRKLLNGILDQCDIKDKENAIIAIDKLDKIGKSGVTKELLGRGFAKKQIEDVFKIIQKDIKLNDIKNKITSEQGLEGLQELSDLMNYLKPMNVKNVQFDISLARGLAYYTGTVFEVFLTSGKLTSSLAGGGRYDNMIGGYLGGRREIPAVGISFGISTIMDALKLSGKNAIKTPAKVYVIPLDTLEESLDIVEKLRKEGVNSDFAIAKKGVSKNLDYANAFGIPFVIIIGENEVKSKKVTLREMKTGKENLVSLSEAVKIIKKV